MGTDSFTFRVSDGTFFSNTATVTLNVVPVNERPLFVSTPVDFVVYGENYVYGPKVVDLNNDILTFNLFDSPVGMTFDPTTGRLDWTADILGDQIITLGVVDPGGLFDVQSFTLRVRTPPSIDSVPPLRAILGATYQYQVSATDADADPLVYSLRTAPAGMAIDSMTGEILYAPTDADIGFAPVEVVVTDPWGLEDVQSYLLIVHPDLAGPELLVTISPEFAAVSENITVHVEVADEVAVASLTVLLDGNPLPLDANGDALISFPTAGAHTLVVTATDPAGNVSNETRQFGVGDENDVTPPTVVLTSPVDDQIFTMPGDIVGQIDDENFLEYTLSLRRGNETEFFEIGGGNVPTDGVLGQIDPTLLPNGIFVLRVEAVDINGQTTTQEVPIRVDGNAKVGLFTLSFVDLQIPVSGIPITITRTYDSRIKTKEDFGVGWTLDVAAGEFESNRKPGDGWDIISAPPPTPTPCVEGLPLKSHVTQVRLSDREYFEFSPVLTNTAFFDIGVCRADMVFVQSGGTRPNATLDIIGNNQVLSISGEDVLRDDGDFSVFDPQRVLLTTPEGIKYEFDKTDGVVFLEDRNANQIFITNNGIIHSTGKSVLFNRDAAGRIETITDPMGFTLGYEYDAAGDLVGFVDQENNRTEFTYDDRHNLVDIINALGIRATRQEYDESGRVIATIDPAGNRTEFVHDVEGRQSIITDRLGQPTELIFDERGNVLQETKFVTLEGALTPVPTTQTFDERDNLLTTTDPNGNTTTWTYDLNNNKLTETDALMNTTTWTYNARNQMGTETDALGFVWRNVYDAQTGDLINEVDRLGNTSTTTYNATGLMASKTDRLGNTTLFGYTPEGYLAQTTDALGHATDFSYDALGNETSSTRYRTDENGDLVAMVTQNSYDALNRRVEERDEEGFVRTTEYDADGRVTAYTDENGSRTEILYDDVASKIAMKKFADGTTESHEYDAEGRRISLTNRSGRVTSSTYDELGRLIKTVYPDMSARTTEFDLAGNVTASIGENGNRTTHEYDAVGRRVFTRTPMGSETTFHFDVVGNPIATTDANARTVMFEFDAARRLVATRFPDQPPLRTTYDAAGSIIRKEDQAGLVTQFEYDALGQLLSVTDSTNQTTTYTYDEVQNLVSQTDANDHTQHFSYDNLGRMISRVLPLGQRETMTYDGNGNITSKTTMNGDTIVFAYDINNRMVSKLVPGQPDVTITYRPTGERQTIADGRGTTAYTYDMRDRQIRVDHPEGSFIAYTYDLAGNRTSVTTPAATVTYTFDAENRMKTVTDPAAGTAVYAYDPVGNEVRVDYPNGTVAERSYDALDRVLSVENRTAGGTIITKHVYSLDPAGNRTRATEHDGRVVEWTYDSLHRLTSETVTDPILGNDSRVWTYDPVGNRTSETENGVTTLYGYDANDRLLSAGNTTFTFDENGNQTSKNDGTDLTTYVWDAENRLIGASVNSTPFAFSYDVDGLRQSRSENGLLTTFIVDTGLPFAEVLEERNATAALKVRYAHGRDLLLQERPTSTGLGFFHQDGLGSTRALSDFAGSASDSFEFSAFGELSARSGSSESAYLFAGEQTEEGLDLQYLRARYYDPATGRFLATDPFLGNPTLPSTLHPYVYAMANPTNAVDPSGEQFLLISVVIAVGIVSILPAAALAGAPEKTVEGQAVVRGRAAKPKAIKIAEAMAKTYLPAARIIIARWFGARTNPQFTLAHNRWGQIASGLRSATVKKGQAGKGFCTVRSGLYAGKQAHAYTDGSDVFVCKPFGSSGVGGGVGTMIHEGVHIALGTSHDSDIYSENPGGIRQAANRQARTGYDVSFNLLARSPWTYQWAAADRSAPGR